MKVRTYGQQKAGLTRVLNGYRKAVQTCSGYDDEPRALAARAKVVAECRRVIAEWDSEEWAQAHRVRRGAWPDDWARWQRALSDVFPVFAAPRLDDL